MRAEAPPLGSPGRLLRRLAVPVLGVGLQLGRAGLSWAEQDAGKGRRLARA